ncbi:MAG: response regulator transcription factor [Saprospiraceae bacterium]|nr:response regulator transcription factor [Saprospiraceae bacterium]
MAQENIKICIVEDDDDIRFLTKQVIELSDNIHCSAEFSSAEDFIKHVDEVDVDFVLMDIGLPGMSGTECVRKCNLNNKNIDFIMYTTHFDAYDVFDALKAGAKGYILKGGDPLKLVEDIFDMAAGGSPMSPQISRLVTDSFNQCNQINNELHKLTKQEWEVLSGLNKGLSYKEIAAGKFVSAHTVRAQIRSIYEKLNVHSKLDAVRIFQKNE